MKRFPPALSSILLASGLVAGVVVATGAIALRYAQTYGYSLFLGVPLVAGSAASMLYARKAPLTPAAVFGVTSPVVLFASLGLLLIGTDGVVCVAMTLPISLPMAWRAVSSSTGCGRWGSEGGPVERPLRSSLRFGPCCSWNLHSLRWPGFAS